MEQVYVSTVTFTQYLEYSKIQTIYIKIYENTNKHELQIQCTRLERISEKLYCFEKR